MAARTNEVASRGGFPASQRGRVAPRSINCNRCRKPLATTVFVCACDCVFCEECTYGHFNSSSTCPVCSKTLGATDFMELVIADPSSATEETTLKNTFQTIFTKHSSTSNALSHQEMCSRLLRNFDDDRRTIRFILKQFVLDSKTAGQQTGNIGRAYENLKKEYTNLKQSTSSQRIQTEQTVADLQHRVQALTGSLHEMQKKIDDKDQKLAQFRHMYAAESQQLVPSSSHSNSSAGGRRISTSGNSAHSRPTPPRFDTRHKPAPPMAGFVQHKQARERANAHHVSQMSRARGPNFRSGGGIPGGGIGTDADSVITPIQIPPPSSQRRRHHSPAVHPATPRMRDLSAGSGYVFSSRSRDQQKRQRSPSPGGFGFSQSRSGGRPSHFSGGGGFNNGR